MDGDNSGTGDIILLVFRDLVFWQFGICKHHIGAATHVKEEEAIRVNGELKSVKSSNDLMGLAQSAFHTWPMLLRIAFYWQLQF
jgi:hypothetical protein